MTSSSQKGKKHEKRYSHLKYSLENTGELPPTIYQVYISTFHSLVILREVLILSLSFVINSLFSKADAKTYHFCIRQDY